MRTPFKNNNALLLRVAEIFITLQEKLAIFSLVETET